MVVTCGNCRTSYRLEVGLIKGERAKVRCSRCRHVFWVSPEGVVTEISPEAEEMPVPAEVPSGAEELPAGPQVAAQAGLTSASAPASQQGPPLVSLGGEPEPPPETITLSGKEPSRLSSWLGRLWDGSWGAVVLAVVSGCLAGLVLGGASWWYFHVRRAVKPAAPEAAQAIVPFLPAAPTPDLKDAKEILINSPKARYRGLVDSQGGQLLVIQGEVTNISPQPRGPVQLKAVLTDSQNKPVKEQLFYAGTTFADHELQKLAPEEIGHWLSTPGGRTQRLLLNPGEKQPFTVVFFKVPEDLAEGGYGYYLEVVKGPSAASP